MGVGVNRLFASVDYPVQVWQVFVGLGFFSVLLQNHTEEQGFLFLARNPP